MIEHTKKLVEDKFTTLNGYANNAEVHICIFFPVLMPSMLGFWELIIEGKNVYLVFFSNFIHMTTIFPSHFFAIRW